MFSFRDLYPNQVGLTQFEQTIPESTEQKLYEQVEETVPPVVAKAGNIWISLIVIVVLLWLFNII